MDPTVVAKLAQSLCSQAGLQLIEREEVRSWALSGVERLHVHGPSGTDKATVIFKYARAPFTGEAAYLDWLHAHEVPVPELYSSDEDDGLMGMLIEDLGTPTRPATIDDAAQAAAAIHRAPPPPGLTVLDSEHLAQLPTSALDRMIELRHTGRWVNGVDDIGTGLHKLEQIATSRAEGVGLAPWGLCHSEFHPTSIHIGPNGWRLLDWARAFIGPALLDLASWQNTADAPDLDAFNTLLDAYIDAGGPPEAASRRGGGLDPASWAFGWHRIWVIDWYLEQCTTWINDPDQDPLYQDVIRRHLAEALECLHR